MAKFAFKLLSGEYRTRWPKAVVYKKGDIVSTDRDLAKIFGAHRFMIVDVIEPKKVAAGSESQKGAAGSPSIPPVLDTKYGKDVTASFKKAVDSELKVYVDSDGMYTVVDTESDNVMNVKPLKNGKEVNKFISVYAE